MSRIRRTQAEIEAGLTVEQKKRGLTLNDLPKIHEEGQKAQEVRKTAKEFKKPRKDPNPIVESWEEVDHNYQKVYKYRVKEKIVEKEVPVVKEVRILNGTKKTEKTVQEILDRELQKCQWEWKEVKMDSSFRTSLLKDLGKKGWKMAYIMEWRSLKPEWKGKPDTMFFQRPRPIGG